MIFEQAELPEGLVRAQRDGRLVLFVGAGVSKDPPASLPLFADLAHRVAQRFEATIMRSDPPAKALGDLKRQGLNVHRAVRDIIVQSEEPNAGHKAVAALAKVGQSVRVVTTNYDRHLSRSLPTETRTYDAPSLPEDLGFDGVVHLHGSVDQEPDKLVVTDSDFARAYVTPNSSTLRFLQQLFASRTVLFIGYSLKDTLMRYILDGNTPEGPGSFFVLTNKPDRQDWRALGVEVVECSHGDQPALLKAWAQRVGADYGEHDRRVAEILSVHTSHGHLTRQEKSYLSHVVSDPDLVHIFTKNARGPVWIRWLGTLPEMSRLFQPMAELGFIEKELIGWFVSHLSNDETAAEVAGLIVDNGGRLHEMLWLNMVMLLNRRPGGNPEAASQLMLILANSAPPDLDNVLLGLLKQCDTPRDDDLFLELVDRAFRPKMTGPDPKRLSSLLPGPFHTMSNTPSDGWLRGSPEKVFWSTRCHLASDLLGIVDGHLRRVHRIETIAGNPDPFAERAAIESHDQNLKVRSTDFLVDAARDLYEFLATDSPEIAAGYLRSWTRSQWVVLNRLAIHGWSERCDVSADCKIKWLLNQQSWLHDNLMHHETMRLIAKTVPAATESTIGGLIDRIVGSYPNSQRTFDKLGWTAHHADCSATARQAFDEAKRNNPGRKVSDHPDFLTWVEDSTATPLPRYLEGIHPRDLGDRLMSDPEAAAVELLAIAKPEPNEQGAMHSQRLAQTVRKATELSPSAGLTLLETLVEHPNSDPQARRDLATAVLIELVNPASVRETTREHGDRIGRLLPNLWNAGIAHWGLPSHSPTSDGCPRTPAKLWPSLLARLAIEKATAQEGTDPQSQNRLSADDKRFLEKAIVGDAQETKLAQVTCAHHLLILCIQDRQWATQHVLPLLDATIDPERALRCWDSYLHQQPWPPTLPDDTLFTHFRAFAGLAVKCCDKAQKQYGLLGAYLCVTDANQPDRAPEWLTGFTSKASDAIRTQFIRSTTRMLRYSDPKVKVGQWHRWMRCYWQERLENYPTEVTEQEKTALADWVMLAGEDFPTAVKSVLASPTALKQGSILPEEMLHASLPEETRREPENPGALAELAAQHPEATVQLIAHLLEHTDQPTAQQWDIRMGHFIKQLQYRIDTAAFKPLREQLLRRGWYYMIAN